MKAKRSREIAHHGERTIWPIVEVTVIISNNFVRYISNLKLDRNKTSDNNNNNNNDNNNSNNNNNNNNSNNTNEKHWFIHALI